MKNNNIPIIPLRGLALFPGATLHFDVARPESWQALDASVNENSVILLITQKDKTVEVPKPYDLEEVGTIGIVKNVLKIPNSIIRVVVEGMERARIKNITQETPFMRADLEVVKTINLESLETEALYREARALFSEYTKNNERMNPDIINTIGKQDNAVKFCDAASDCLPFINKQKMLKEADMEKRLEYLVTSLIYETEIQNVDKKIKNRVRMQIDKNQKEFYLREQIKAIQEELGDDGEEVEELQKKINELHVPETVREKLNKELKRMARLNSSSPEMAVSRNYLEYIVELPWAKMSEDNLDLFNAQKVLDEDHYGLEKIKDRIIEFLAVRQMSDLLKGPILCLVGPPGVGKTSIVKSVAKALNRKYVRMSLGGLHDEAEIRGHRKTYIGAMPGRIISNLKLAGTVNPVFLLDEIDKLCSDYKGDPSSALLEVLDPEQNSAFRDNYLEIPFDLSKVIFITTANDANAIPKPLFDRMELIEMSGYTEVEKFEIARRHLVKKQLLENGISDENLMITDEAIRDIINLYTKESGVRNLEREIGKICRKTVRKLLEDKSISLMIVDSDNLKDYLGKYKYKKLKNLEHSEIGAATGLAWTSAGGDTLTIEVKVMKGKGDLKLTGHLGEVMKESAYTALSFIRSRADKYEIKPEFFYKMDLHIHIPEGAIPKDGPSAGITLATAILSALTGKAVRNDVAMTGEITLRGNVLPIGGLKEKALAAHRAGIHNIIIPKDNERDLVDIPQYILNEMNFIGVANIENVFASALEGFR